MVNWKTTKESFLGTLICSDFYDLSEGPNKLIISNIQKLHKDKQKVERSGINQQCEGNIWAKKLP